MIDYEAQAEGYDAYWEGVDRDSNPYDQEKEPQKRQSWEVGWHEARKHDYDEDD
jgi:ribosome modulation factor